MPPRLTPHQRRVRDYHRQWIKATSPLILAELQALWRDVRVKLRRLDQARPKIQEESQRLAKAYYLSQNLWGRYMTRLNERLLQAVKDGLITLTALNEQYIRQAIGPAIHIDTDEFARLYQHELGLRITQVVESTQRKVGREIVKWYNQPGATMGDIVRTLTPLFDLDRAHLIAQTEITSLNSKVQTEIADRLGIGDWWWQTERDSLVCQRRMRGPDNNWYKGCRELHGKIFKVGAAKMPPSGSHPGCRCNPVLMLPKAPRIQLPAQPIVDISHLVQLPLPGAGQ